MKIIAALTFALAAPLALAAPFDKGDAQQGKALHDKLCASCHAAKFGGLDQAVGGWGHLLPMLRPMEDAP